MLSSLSDREAERLQALYQYQILDTPPEEAFDDLAQLAIQICGTSVAIINLIDRDRQWFKAKVGLEIDAMPLDLGICPACIAQGLPLAIPDTLADEDYATHPAVVGFPYVRFYLGVPLITPNGQAIGTLCVADSVPKTIKPEYISALEALARQVISQLELRRNLAERQKAEAALRQAANQNLQLAQAIASTTDGIIITDAKLPDNPIIYTNPAFTQVTGYSAEEARGCNCRFLQGKETDRRVIAQIQEAIAARRGIQTTILNYRKDGQPFWNELKISPVFSQHGDLLYFVGVQTDITQRKQVEEALRDSENRLRTLIDAEPECVKLVDTQGKVLEMNAAGLAMIEAVHPNEVVGQCVYPIVASEYRQAFQALIEQVCQGESGTLEFEIVGLKGTRRWLETHAVPFCHSNAFVALSITRDITQRKQAEAALRESEERWQLALRGNNDGIWDWNVKTNEVFFSPRWKEMLGYADHEVSNHLDEWSKRVHPDDADWVLQAIQDHFHHKTPFYITEHRLQCKDGSYKWILDRGQALWDDEGNVIRMTGSHTDTTQRREAEETLRQQKEVLQTIVDHVPVMLTFFNPDGKLFWANRHWEQTLGWKVEEIQERDVMAEFYPDRHERQQVLDFINSAERVWGDFPIRTRSGKMLETCWANVRLSDGSTIGIGQDISDRKKAETALREQATLLDKAQDAILVVDMNDRVLFWNCSAERLFGWTAEEAIAKTGTTFLFGSSERLDQVFNQTVHVGEWHGELQLKNKENQELIVESRWTLVRDKENNPKSILIVNTDITQKKQLERQFLRAQRMESIGTLAGGIAHDLNNVLSPILMSVQLLGMKFHDEQSKQWLEILENSTKRGAELVKQVLSFARGMEGKRVALEIGHIVWEIKQIVQETFPRSIEIRTNLIPDLQMISGDATQLHQVLMNLCVNARDAMPNGGILTIAAENLTIDENYARMHLDAKEGSYVVLTVSDTGVGIPPEMLDRIFEPFFTNKELGKGTGLGLSTALGIVRSHGGFISVFSQIGQGTQFKVFLPADEGYVVTKIEKLEIPAGQGELILIVDDEPAIRDITQRSLQTYGYTTLTASDGIEAIALYARQMQNIRLVLVDLMMPALDGADTIRTLRRINPEVKVIAMSGLSPSHTLPNPLGTKVQHFLAKPFTAEELLTLIHKALC